MTSRAYQLFFLFGFGFFDSLFPFMFGLVFLLIISVFVVLIVRSLTIWKKNNNSPRLTVKARVVAKRTAVSSGSRQTMASTRYFATFEFASQDRLELPVPSQQFGLLAENDTGDLTFQGTRFLDFTRKRDENNDLS